MQWEVWYHCHWASRPWQPLFDVSELKKLSFGENLPLELTNLLTSLARIWVFFLSLVFFFSPIFFILFFSYFVIFIDDLV